MGLNHGVPKCYSLLDFIGILGYGGRRDLTIGYFCSGGIHKWGSKDVPWREHVQHYPGCGYVKMLITINNVDVLDMMKEKVCQICGEYFSVLY